MSNLKLSPPWIEFFEEIKALFGQDPQIKVEYDNDNHTIKLYVDGNPDKYEALTKILPETREFGNIVVSISIIPSNSRSAKAGANVFETAFQGNPAFKRCVYAKKGLFGDLNYVVFKNEVVQYFNDDLSDVNGLRSTLYQDIAKDVFKDTASFGTYFCTEAGGNMKLNSPLGEWP